MPRLSIVVLARTGEFSLFEDTLAAILRNQPESSEIIAVHDGGYGDRHDLRGVGVRLAQVRGAKSPADLFTATLSHCRGEFVHVLQAGMLVDEGWCEAALAEFRDPRVAAVTPLIVSEAHPDRLVAAGLSCSRTFKPRLVGKNRKIGAAGSGKLTPLGPTLWAAFYRMLSLRPVFKTLREIPRDLLDLEIALCHRELKLLNPLSVRSIVSVESPQALWRRIRPSERSAFAGTSVAPSHWFDVRCAAINHLRQWHRTSFGRSQPAKRNSWVPATRCIRRVQAPA